MGRGLSAGVGAVRGPQGNSNPSHRGHLPSQGILTVGCHLCPCVGHASSLMVSVFAVAEVQVHLQPRCVTDMSFVLSSKGEPLPPHQDPGRLLLLRVGPHSAQDRPRPLLRGDGPGHDRHHHVSAGGGALGRGRPDCATWVTGAVAAENQRHLARRWMEEPTCSGELGLLGLLAALLFFVRGDRGSCQVCLSQTRRSDLSSLAQQDV